jgi:hypothetical protein
VATCPFRTTKAGDAIEKDVRGTVVRQVVLS